MNKIFNLGQVVRLIKGDVIGKIINVDVDRNSNTIYQLQIPNDPHKRWFLARDLELFHHKEL